MRSPFLAHATTQSFAISSYLFPPSSHVSWSSLSLLSLLPLTAPVQWVPASSCIVLDVTHDSELTHCTLYAPMWY